MEKEKMKKDLQKMCKNFRETIGNKRDYPKAIMTVRQIELSTASINCGGCCDSNKKHNQDIRKSILESEKLKEFIEKWNIKSATEETTSFGDYIIRLRY